MSKLAIFYTDNMFPEIITLSLETLYKSVTDDIRIITCVNHHIENNPFEEVIVYNPIRNHYNIIEKILAGMNHVNLKDYNYISFLEHDVLYPEGYFDYPDFTSTMCNENYIGMIATGFQKRVPGQMPLHQMVMTTVFALQHFQNLLKPAKTHGVVVEPHLDAKWTSKFPAIHLNHGKNFTSHFNCYSQTTTPVDDYWGNYLDIWNKIKH
jgi:hypothetical protein